MDRNTFTKLLVALLSDVNSAITCPQCCYVTILTAPGRICKSIDYFIYKPAGITLRLLFKIIYRPVGFHVAE